jgi:hypothetical protein
MFRRVRWSVSVCVYERLFEKIEITNNSDDTHTDTDIFFANDYKAVKRKRYTPLEYARIVQLTHVYAHRQTKDEVKTHSNRLLRIRLRLKERAKERESIHPHAER